jgi:GMP synthase-like glutamine amidotransferase
MKTHVLQHVSFEDIGSIGPFLKERQAVVTYTRFYLNDALPEINGLDLIIIMGGPMSVNDEALYSWLPAEKEFIRNAALQSIPLIGICLGAQLIANALGARVYPNAEKEIGWFPVTAAPSEENYFHFPKQLPAFHWHGETFDLPPGAVLLARSEACKNQAFQIGKHVIGLQFHLETTPESLDRMTANCRNELIPGRYIQTEKEMRQVPPAQYEKVNAIMSEILSYIAP